MECCGTLPRTGGHPARRDGINSGGGTRPKDISNIQARSHLHKPYYAGETNSRMIAKQCGISCRDHPALIDIDYGQWQGLTPEEVKKRWPKLLADWYASPGQVRKRCELLYYEMTLRHENQTVLLVGHTVINRVIILAALGLSAKHFWRLGQDPCALNIIDTKDAGASVFVLLNDACHL
jgi:broad specificity phosphatase PhoE